MKSTGVVRRVDDLGRIVIPKEIRRTLRIRDGEELEIFVDNEDIIFKMLNDLLTSQASIRDFSENLGVLIHFFCDYTCIYHANDYLYENHSIAKHLKYELMLHRYAVKKLETLKKVETIPFESVDEIKKYVYQLTNRLNQIPLTRSVSEDFEEMMVLSLSVLQYIINQYEFDKFLKLIEDFYKSTDSEKIKTWLNVVFEIISISPKHKQTLYVPIMEKAISNKYNDDTLKSKIIFFLSDDCIVFPKETIHYRLIKKIFLYLCFEGLMTKKTDNIVIKIMSFLSSFIVNHANQTLILNDLFYVTVLELIIQICCYYCFNN